MKNEYMENLLQATMDEPAKLTRGTLNALWAYRNEETLDDMLVVSDLGFDTTISDTMDTFEAAGYTKLIITDHSTALMACLHAILNRGWQITGTYTREPETPWERTEYGLIISRV